MRDEIIDFWSNFSIKTENKIISSNLHRNYITLLLALKNQVFPMFIPYPAFMRPN